MNKNDFILQQLNVMSVSIYAVCGYLNGAYTFSNVAMHVVIVVVPCLMPPVFIQ